MKYVSIAVCLLCLLLPSFCHAQAGFTDDVNDTPIDGGLSLLISAGVGYGAKKIKEKKQQFK